jgi:hypothetical protein
MGRSPLEWLCFFSARLGAHLVSVLDAYVSLGIDRNTSMLASFPASTLNQVGLGRMSPAEYAPRKPAFFEFGTGFLPPETGAPKWA